MSIQTRKAHLSYPAVSVRLKEAIRRHQARTGKRVTYLSLAEGTGLSRATIESIATRKNYNPSLDVIARLCHALGCSPGDLLVAETKAKR